MNNPLLLLGLGATGAAIVSLLVAYWRRPRREAYPAYGYAGWLILLAGELLLFLRIEPVTTFFTPIAWTGYLLLADAAVFALRGRSLLRSAPRTLVGMAFWSVPLWLVFEAYNWHLRNWTYVGLPEALWQQALGTLWSFATILPALAETAALLEALGFCQNVSARGWRFWLGRHNLMVIVGVLFLAGPLALPAEFAAYLFALVWLGFIFLLEPVNLARGHESLLGDVKRHQGQRLYCWMAAGMICGLLWEFWNYWAGGRWAYVFPFGQEWKVFEMPLPGYLGFPFFALEFFAMYSFVIGEWQRGFTKPAPERVQSS